MALRSKQHANHSRRKRHPGAPERSARPPIEQMTPGELCTWIVVTRAALQKRMAGERASLDRRATRAVSIPTDEAYGADQRFEAELVEMLTECERVVTQLAAGGMSI